MEPAILETVSVEEVWAPPIDRQTTVHTIMVTAVTASGMSLPAQGLGCMGMSGAFGAADWDESVTTIRRALDLGVTLLDTADVYGSGHNEVLVGRAVAGRRDEVQIATKFGIDHFQGTDGPVIRGERAYVRRSCEGSLTRLGVDHIDLYYLHRPPQTAAIEETVGAMAELVQEGKVRQIGLSEVDDSQLRRAFAVHPIAAVQSEYSLWTRDPESTVAAALADLGVALVPYCPLGRGFLTGTVDPTTMADGDFRRTLPRFAGAAGQTNLVIVAAVARVAQRLGVTPAQVALAWVHQRSAALGVPVVPIPGTKRVRWLEENVSALDIELTAEDSAELDPLHEQVVGSRTNFHVASNATD
jgi:aryl-alcohol dehydrogenase-like predicted oxidoreductase